MSDAILSDLQRRLGNLVRSGVIADVQPSPLRVKVKIGDLITDWLRPQMPAAGAVSISYLPTMGEGVQIISESGDLRNGVAHLGLHTTRHEPPTTEPGVYKIRFSDGTAISYDINGTILNIGLAGGKVGLQASPEGWVFKGKAIFEDEIIANKTIDAEGNIGTRAELSDSKGTMARVREIFNGHDHDETDSVTLPPNQPM